MYLSGRVLNMLETLGLIPNTGRKRGRGPRNDSLADEICISQDGDITNTCKFYKSVSGKELG
jgi:hypothetical protein